MSRNIDHCGVAVVRQPGRESRGIDDPATRSRRQSSVRYAAPPEIRRVEPIRDEDVPGHLSKPRCGHIRADALGITQNDPCSPDGRVHLQFLHQLAAWYREEPGQVTPLILLGAAHFEEVSGAPRLGSPFADIIAGCTLHARPVGDLTGFLSGGSNAFARTLWIFSRLAELEFVARQGPADRSIAQSAHFIRKSDVEKRLRTHQAARAPSAVND